MTIKVNIKQLGSKRDKIGSVDFPIEGEPSTVRELIAAAVHTCISEYNDRVKNCKASCLSDDEISKMSEIGKIAFGINYGGKKADEAKALEAALSAYEDGLYRIFIGENEAGGLDDRLTLFENQSVTFIRLTMLSGRMW